MERVMVIGGVSRWPRTEPQAVNAALVRPSPSTFRQVEVAVPIGSGATQVPQGAVGVAFDLSQDDIEIDFYSPKHVVAFATLSQLHVR